LSYRRETPSRRAQQTRPGSMNPVPKSDRPPTEGLGRAPFRPPPPPGPPTPADVSRAPGMYPLLSNSSAAAAILESRARASGRRANGEDVLDALQFVRVNDVCRLLRISKPTLWRLRRANEFPEPTELTDRVIAWRRSEIETWLRERAGGAHSSTTVASTRPPPPLTEGDDASRTTKIAKPETTSISRRRSKAAQRKSSDEQLALPLLARD
jgi:prophage regulatory protein